MFIVIKSEHYDCTNLICKKDTLEDAVAAVKDSMAQRINKNYHTGLTGADITHENEDHYGFSFTFEVGRLRSHNRQALLSSFLRGVREHQAHGLLRHLRRGIRENESVDCGKRQRCL